MQNYKLCSKEMKLTSQQGEKLALGKGEFTNALFVANLREDTHVVVMKTVRVGIRKQWNMQGNSRVCH